MVESPAKGRDSEGLEQLVERGANYLQEDKVTEARLCFDEALSRAPKDEKILGLLGLTLFRLEDFESASGIYETLVSMRPADASYRLNLGLVHLKLGRPNDAIGELERSRELDPSQIRTVSYLGLAHARNGAYPEAYEAFLRADQNALATEMEQYLDVEQQQAIRDLVGGAEDDSDSSAQLDEAFRAFEEPEPASTPDPAAESECAAETESAPAAESESAPAFESESVPTLESESAPESEIAAAPESESGVPRALRNAAGMITRAVSQVLPSDAATAHTPPPGHLSPQPVSALATSRLLRPSEGGETLEIGAGGVLIARVQHRLISRTQGVMVSSGELGFEPATRRVRGKQSDEVFGSGDAQLFSVSGEGYLVASACGEVFTAVRLDGDIVYVREEYVFAFEPDLRWENGRIPGSDLRVAQFRGNGCVAVRTPKDLLSVKLSAERVMYVEGEVLAGWIGRVVPRLVKPAAGGRASSAFVECSGEGVVLLHDMQGHN